MELGTTFLLDVAGSQLWVVISDPKRDPENVLIVSLTAEKDYKDHACVLDRGIHPWVTRRTCAAYYRTRIVKLKELYEGKDTGLLKVQAPAPSEMLRAIQEGFERSDQIKNQIKAAGLQLLKQQGILGTPPAAAEAGDKS